MKKIQYVINPDVAAQWVSDNLCLVDEKTSTYFVLRPEGGFLLQEMSSGKNLEESLRQLEKKGAKISDEQVEELIAHKILIPGNSLPTKLTPIDHPEEEIQVQAVNGSFILRHGPISTQAIAGDDDDGGAGSDFGGGGSGGTGGGGGKGGSGGYG